MKISIAMATYNGAKYLPDQLQSFVDQILQPDELVVFDDRSTDSTPGIIEKFAKTAPFDVFFLRNERNIGCTMNFNATLMQTSGDLVLLSDQDDVWFPEKIAYLSELAEKHQNQMLIMNDAALVNADLNEIGLTKLGQIRSAGYNERSFMMGCCCAIRRELLNLCLPIPEGYQGHDNWIVDFAIGLGCRLISDRVLQYYRRHGDNESQFIGNRTVKLTKWQRYINEFYRTLQADSESESRFKLKQKRLYLEGIARAMRRDRAGIYTKQLLEMQTEGRTFLEIMSKRMEIRRKRLPARLIASMNYWFLGGYGRKNSLLDALRDMIG